MCRLCLEPVRFRGNAGIDPGAEFRANVAKAQKAQRRDAPRWIEAGIADGTLAAELFCSAVDGLIYHWQVNAKAPIKEMHELFKREVRRSLANP